MNARIAIGLAFVLASVACGDSNPPPQVPATPAAPAPTAAPAQAAPTDPAPTVEGDMTIAMVNGLQVIVKRVPGAEFTVGELFIRGGVRNWTKDNAGIEDIALQVAAQGGTQKLAKEPFTRKLAALGATLKPVVQRDFSLVSVKAPAAAWDESFGLLADVALAPALPASEFDLVKQRELQDRKHELEDGDGRLTLAARHLTFAGHPYANDPRGEVASVTAIQQGDVAPYLAKLRETSRWLLVVAGDVDAAHVIDLARAAFGSVPRGAYVDAPLPPLHFDGGHIAGDPYKLPTNYVQSDIAGPAWGDPDVSVMRLALGILRERLFDEVRTKRNLSYAPSAWLEWDQSLPIGSLYVTAVDPSTTLKVMFDQVARLQNEPVPEREFAGAKAVYVSRMARNEETTDGIAARLGTAQILGGDWRLADKLNARLRAATQADVQAAAKKWMANWQTAIVGDPGKLDAKIVGAK